MNKSSYPPSHLQHSTPITPTAALAHLETYLQQSTTSPHLHPDALLHPGGISYSSTGGGPQGGIILHQLRRIAAGLRGEVLAPDPEEALEDFGKPEGDDARLDKEKERVRKRFGDDEVGRSALRKKRARVEGAAVDSEGEVLKNGDGDGGEESEWVDGEEYARRQVVLEGEVGDRGGVPVDENGEEPSLVTHQAGGAGPKSEREKEARKADKKARKKAEQREKEKSRAAG